MNRRIQQEDETENENPASSAAKIILWGILAGFGLGIGYFIVRKMGIK